MQHRSLLERFVLAPFVVAMWPLVLGACDESAEAAAEDPAPTATSASAEPSAVEEVDGPTEPAVAASPAAPTLGARAYATIVYEKPSTSSARLGYLRLGAVVERSPEPAGTRGCKGGWYAIEPRGFVCTGEDASIDPNDPVVRAASVRPNRDAPMPYHYGFVRSVLPMYLRVPTSQQQFKSEFKLEEHLEWFKEHKNEVQTAELGAYDVPVDLEGRAIAGRRLGELGRIENTSEMSLGELFGGTSDDDPWPFWLRGNERLIPNVSDFEVPEYAIFADRARRHTGLAFIGSFGTGDHHLRRRFAITTDLRLAPTTKVKPDAGSPWHGVELSGEQNLPFAFVRKRGAVAYRIDGDQAQSAGELPRRSSQKLSGKVKRLDDGKYLELTDGRWVYARDVGMVLKPSKFPGLAKKGERWIEIDLSEQVLVLWEGTKPVFATLVSTGRPAVGDPDTTTATPRGTFRVYAKHISATMDSDEGVSKRKQAEDGLEPGDEGYIPEKGDGTYGVTLRRGHGLFQLRDVPYIQYFEKQYAIHGAYWHDVFGIPRSHGCVNLAPADALRVFKFTDDPVPEGWHGLNVDRGTAVVIHK